MVVDFGKVPGRAAAAGLQVGADGDGRDFGLGGFSAAREEVGGVIKGFVGGIVRSVVEGVVEGVAEGSVRGGVTQVGGGGGCEGERQESHEGNSSNDESHG